MIRRNITQHLLDALADTPVVLINGARQTGKSTLAKSIAESTHPARYITLDTASVLAAVRNDAAGFIAGLDGAVVIDEVQKAPELFSAIKADVDRKRRPGKYLLTGSANVLLVPNLSESLAGRMEILRLWPFSQGELIVHKETFVDRIYENKIPFKSDPPELPLDLQNKIINGGYPEVQNRVKEERRRAWFESYMTTILQRDIRDLANIEGLTSLPRLLALIAARSPALLNFAELSRSLAIPQSTLKRYMTLLEATFLIQQLPAWSGNFTKRLVKTSKMVMTDTGLMAHLIGLDKKRLETGAMIGPLFENFVIMELRKQITWCDVKPQMFHFRTQAGQEVDILLEDRSGHLVGIEAKASATVHAHDFKGLRALAEATGERFRRGIVLYKGTKIIPFGESLTALPVQLLWQA
ncbi:MAG: ATP-binding protein [Syntrophaceae bacterium]|nr:ATP-binding protein [Syntrophaceae bacterium]